MNTSQLPLTHNAISANVGQYPHQVPMAISQPPMASSTSHTIRSTSHTNPPTSASTAVQSHRTPTGPASTQQRGIFIQNLDPRVSWQVLKDNLRRCGEVSFCDVKLAGNGTKPSCAIATFSDSESAQRAVKMFDGLEFPPGCRRNLRVKLNGSKGSGNAASGSKPRGGNVSSSGSSRGGVAAGRISVNKEQSSEKRKDSASAAAPLVIDGNKARFSSTEESDDDDHEDDDSSVTNNTAIGGVPCAADDSSDGKS